VPLITSPIRSMAELAALGAPFGYHMMTPGWSATRKLCRNSSEDVIQADRRATRRTNPVLGN
jgi:hypothetical protein